MTSYIFWGLYFVLALLLIGLPLAAIGKFYERRMTFLQHWLVGSMAAVISIVLYVVMFLAYLSERIWLGILPSWTDRLVYIAIMLATGTAITVISRRSYGITKKGRLELGAKVMLTMVLLSWIPLILFYVARLAQSFL